MRRNLLSGFKGCALQSFVKIQKILLILPKIKIPQAKRPVLLLKLKINFVKIAQVSSRAIRLNRNIVIRDGRRNFNAVCKIPAQLKIQIRCNHSVLTISKRKSSPKTSIVRDISKIEKIVTVLTSRLAVCGGLD